MNGKELPTFQLGSDSEMSSLQYSSGAEWESGEELDGVSQAGNDIVLGR